MEKLAVLILALVPVLAALVAAVVYLLIRCRNLARELAGALAVADEWGSLLALEHETNYRMACQLYGRAAVDRAIERANSKGAS